MGRIKFFLFLALVSSHAYAEEQVSLTTYFPSPNAVFKVIYLVPTDQPATGASSAGMLYYNSSGNTTRYYNGSGWVDLGSAGGSAYWELNESSQAICNLNSGRVGINTDDPSGTLEVKGPRVIVRGNGTQSQPLVKMLDPSGSELLRIHSAYSTSGSNIRSFRIGKNAGSLIPNTDNDDVLIGSEACRSCSGSSPACVVIGSKALSVSSGAGNSVVVGSHAMAAAPHAGEDVFIGFAAGYNPGASHCCYDTSIGARSSYNVSATGVAFGFEAGHSDTGAFRNDTLMIGYKAGHNETTPRRMYIHNSDADPPLLYSFINAASSKSILGINTKTPDTSAVMTVNGTVAASGTIDTCSDRRLKKNIENLDHGLDKAGQLQSVSYEWDGHAGINGETGTQLGFIAQDVEKVLPELVREDGEGNKYLMYDGLEAVLVRACQELQERNDSLRKRIRALKEKS